jgi:hypothetical protein
MPKKNRKKKDITAVYYPNLPTRERFAHGRITIRNNIAQVSEPLRIDKLLSNGIIDEMQHLYGMQIITLWTIASRAFIKANNYENKSGSHIPDFEHINLSRMNAEDQFYKTIGFLKKRDHDLIYKICFEEMAAIKAGRQLGLPVNSITVYVRDAFDALGEALAKMRELKKEIEAVPQAQQTLA